MSTEPESFYCSADIDEALSPPNGQSNQELAVLPQNKWPDGHKLTISFVDPGEDINKIRRAIDYIRMWEPYINLRLDFVKGPADIRISFKGDVAYSRIGRAAQSVDPNTPTMFLGSKRVLTDAEFGAMVMHEFGHALGAVHEHQSPASPINWDKPVVYAHYAALGFDNKWVDEQIFYKFTKPMANNTVFDPSSIMLYSFPPHFTVDKYSIKPNLVLSDKDKAFMRQLYPKTISYNMTLLGKSEKWIPTNIPLYAGQQARIRAGGTITFGPWGSWPFTPAGENKIAGNGSPAPGLYKNSLVAIAGGQPVYIGNDNIITASTDTQLYIASNDDYWIDNDGKWDMVIEVIHK